MRILLIVIFFLLINFKLLAESSASSLPKHKWSFGGITGTFDKASVQRGLKVYREVCSGCHSLKLIYYRDLIDVGFSEEQVKAIAADTGPFMIISSFTCDDALGYSEFSLLLYFLFYIIINIT